MAHAAAPTLDADNDVALAQDAELDGLVDAPLQPMVHVLLPVRVLIVRLLLWEQEGIDASVQMRVLNSRMVSRKGTGLSGRMERKDIPVRPVGYGLP